MNVLILLCDFMLNCDFLELLCSSVIAQCWGYRADLWSQDNHCGEGSASRMMDVRQRLSFCCDTWAVCQRQG